MLYIYEGREMRMKGKYRLKVNLRKFRLEHGELTQEKLAELVGVTRQTIISIERGRYKPSIELALLIAKIFNSPVEDIFSLEEIEEGERKNEGMA